MPRDYYDVLGVKKGATEKDIKDAYRRLARKFHPDVNQGDKGAETKFKELSEAYHVLSSKEKRQQYDQFGHAWQQFSGAQTGGPGSGRAGGPGARPQGFGMGADFGDLFESLFASRGGARNTGRPQGPQKGENIEYNLSIPLREAVFGTSKTINVEIDDPCANCSGEGRRIETCSACAGTGMASRGGVLNMGAACQICGGRGGIDRGRCSNCNGSGRVHRQRKLEVKIPAGVDTGKKIRLAGEGVAGTQGGQRGDIHLSIRVEENGFFQRKGDDLICEVPVSFIEAALGAEVTVPTKDGSAKLKIPPGTQSGQLLRLSGLGVPKLQGRGCGDQLVRVKVAVPKKLSRRQRELVEELASLQEDDPRAGLEDTEL